MRISAAGTENSSSFPGSISYVSHILLEGHFVRIAGLTFAGARVFSLLSQAHFADKFESLPEAVLGHLLLGLSEFEELGHQYLKDELLVSALFEEGPAEFQKPDFSDFIIFN